MSIAGSEAVAPTAAPTATPQAVVVSFVSPVNGAGRTSAVANVAWILASAGKRVLAIDWCAKTPRIHEFLRPFHVETISAAEVLGETLAAKASPPPAQPRTPLTGEMYLAPSPGMLYRYALPASTAQFSMIGTVDSQAPGTGAEGAATALRKLLRAAPFDYVLIDSPSDISPTALAFTALLCDVAVICFPPRHTAIRESAIIAESLRTGATGGLRIVAAPTQFEAGESRQGQARDSVRHAFADLLSQQRSAEDSTIDVDLVEVPKQFYDTYDDVLAVLADDPGTPNNLLAAYERLAAAITNDAVRELVAVPQRVRARYRRGVRLTSDERPERFFLRYEPEDRPWADWVRGQLRRAGAEVLSRTDEIPHLPDPTTGSSVVAIVSMGRPPTEVGAPPPDVWQLLAAAGVGTEPDVTGILVGGDAPAAPVLSPQVIDLRGQQALPARARLLSQFGLIAPPQPEGDQPLTPRFPGEVDRRLKFRVPARNPAFVGRNDYFETLRDHLLAGPSHPVTLTGEAGVGKSEIARELAHRFAYDYDVVWWIPAQDRESVRAALADLADELRLADVAEELGLAAGGNAAEATLAALNRNKPSPRWLLIYDNADGARVLDGLLPAGGSGHILITSREADSPGLPLPTEVAAFHGEESVAMLQRRVPGIEVSEARTVAAALDHLPLALRLATAWMQETVALLQRRGNSESDSVRLCTAELRARLDQGPPGAGDERALGSRTSSVAKAMALTLTSMREEPHGRLAIRLAELCAFLSPEGVALRLLRSASMLCQLADAAGLDVDDLLVDASEIDGVLWTGARFALFDVDWGREATLRMHRAVQSHLRDAMSDADRHQRQNQVLRGLAAYAPTDAEAEDPGRAYLFDELQRHLVPSGALDARDREIRHWVVKQIRYLYRTNDGGNWKSARRLAQDALERWLPTGATDQLVMRLSVQLANLYRALGQNLEALELDEQVVAEQRRVLGVRHIRTLAASRGLGGDLRGLGRFDEALKEDQSTFEGFRAVLGDDHPDTLMAANNLALSSYLAGDAREALRLKWQQRDRLRRLFGPDDPRTWWAVCDIGTLQRELGEYEASLSLLREALERIHHLHPPNHLDELRIKRSLAVTERRLGHLNTAKERNRETYLGYRDVLGEAHPYTRGCLLSLAADYHASGDAAYAVRQANLCLRGYERSLDKAHPFTAACAVNLGIFLRAEDEVDRAVGTGERGLTALQRGLGETHPWTMAAAINQAGHLAARGDLTEAVKLQSATRRRCVDYLGRSHPYAVIAIGNLTAMRDREQAGDGAAPVLRDIDIDIPQT